MANQILVAQGINNPIAVIIPCFRVVDKIMGVLENIPDTVSYIFCVDDKCDQHSGKYIEEHSKDPRVTIIFNEQNLGVGGAVKAGYRAALETDANVFVKIDGDGQMRPALLPQFVRPVIDGLCDYTKGNRFFQPRTVAAMPNERLFGNAVLSFMTKISSGYWNIFDPTNGYTAIHRTSLSLLPLEKISNRYFFESDMLFRLNIIRAKVVDIPMTPVYDDEQSSLRIRSIILPFLKGHSKNLIKRVFYKYFLHDFSIASIELILGLVLMGFGTGFGLFEWWSSLLTGQTATAGTVMLAALPIIVGMQLLLSFLNYDISNLPKEPIQALWANAELSRINDISQSRQIEH